MFGPEDDEYMEIRNLYYYHTYWDLVYLNDDHGYRFFETDTVLKNDIRILTDLNLTSIYAPSEKELFEFIAPSLSGFGLDVIHCLDLIKSRPDEWIAILSDSNGEIRLEKWSESLREEYTRKSWSNELSEESVPEMVPF